MQEPIQPNANKDDLNNYNDEKIAIFMRNLQEKSLEDLLKVQAKIAEEYTKANEEYEAERTQIRWARRRYWMLIFVGVFREIWRVLIKGKDTNLSKLKKRKADLVAEHNEKDEDYNTQMSLVHDSIETIKLYAREMSQRTNELYDLNAVIETLDKAYYEVSADEDPEDRLELENQLAKHLEDRDILNGYINELSKKSETLINALAGLLNNFQPDPIPKEFLSQFREANAEKIAALKERCNKIEHPIIPKLLTFLTRRTPGSLDDLQEEIARHTDLFSDRELGDIVWEANSLYPAIFLGKTREQALFDYIALQERELASLQEVMDGIDAQLQDKENASTRKMLDQMIQKRDKLSYEISHLLLLHKDILSGNHTELLEMVHSLARKHSENAVIKDLQRQCDLIPHAVTKALNYFLTYRTDASLRTLRAAMKSDPSYLESRQCVNIIAKAGEIDERITEGWVKEEELPSIKEIQQSYFHEVSGRLQGLESELDTLTDYRIGFEKEIYEIEQQLIAIGKRYTEITGVSPRGYLSRAELNKIKQDKDLYTHYLAVKDEYNELAASLKETKTARAELNKVIEEKEAAKQQCEIDPILFNPEVLAALIKRCEQVTRIGRIHPVAAALARFLNYPTPSLLTKLKIAMMEHPDYKKNDNMVKLLAEANHYFPYIQREPHVAQQRLFDFFRNTLRGQPMPAKEDEHHKEKIRRLGPSSAAND